MELLVAMVLFLVVVALCAWGGMTLILVATRPRAEAPVPPARIANAEPGEAAYVRSRAAAGSAGRAAARITLIAVGVAIIVAPWAVVISIVRALMSWGSGVG